jgi:hypothetical protein
VIGGFDMKLTIQDVITQKEWLERDEISSVWIFSDCVFIAYKYGDASRVPYDGETLEVLVYPEDYENESLEYNLVDGAFAITNNLDNKEDLK